MVRNRPSISGELGFWSRFREKAGACRFPEDLSWVVTHGSTGQKVSQRTLVEGNHEKHHVFFVTRGNGGQKPYQRAKLVCNSEPVQ